jgi:hypothetical protein
MIVALLMILDSVAPTLRRDAFALAWCCVMVATVVSAHAGFALTTGRVTYAG